MLNQLDRMLLQIAEARRMHGTSERDGSVHQVWRKDKEQKIRINMGTRPDGSPWLSPWIKIEAHHGPGRHQHKFVKGQNVKMTTPGADFSQAKVTPSGENNAHPEPQHATDTHETTQYAANRTRVGPDFEERWMASGGQVQGKDPDTIATVLTRWGAKPDNQNDKNQPWDGPDPNQADPKKRNLHWAGTPGNTPAQTGDAITTQFDKDAKTEHVEGGILHKIQSADGPKMSSPDAGDGSAMRTTTDNIKDANVLRKIHDLVNQLTTSTGHTSGNVTHIVMDAVGNIATKVLQKNQVIHQLQDAQGNFSTIMQQAEQVLHMVKGAGGTSTLQITPGSININSAVVQVNSDGFMSPTTPPAIPATDSTGTPPLLNIPTVWMIEANLQGIANLPAVIKFTAVGIATSAANLNQPAVLGPIVNLTALPLRPFSTDLFTMPTFVILS